MEIRRSFVKDPIFSVCIPQYNRTSFLIEVCRSLATQTLMDFEVCISDDCSTDGREQELLEFLKQSGLSFVYRRRDQNGRYDANLRSSIGLASGRYCFLLGNDDGLTSPTALEDVHCEMERFGPLGVAITNYKSASSGRVFRRIQRTGCLGSGPKIAVEQFRNFSFVGGVIFDTRKARTYADSKWDGSEMYQMFMGCRIIAEGGSLFGIDRVVVREGIQVSGEVVDSYQSRPKLKPCPIVERRLPLNMMGHLVVDAVSPQLASSQRLYMLERIYFQILAITYPFWIFEYRRVQSWKYALGICLGMRPANVFVGAGLSFLQRVGLSVVYGLVSLTCLCVPIRLFDWAYPSLYRLAKGHFALQRDTERPPLRETER